MVDGEIVVAGSDGRLDFFSLQQRLHPAASRVDLLAGETPAQLRGLRPARARRRGPDGAAVLRAAVGARGRSADARPPVHLTPITRDEALAREWFVRFEGAGLDGIIAKAGEQAYVPDKRVMTKIKHVRTADCVLAGYRVHKSGPDAIGSLMLGLYDDGTYPVPGWNEGGLRSVGVVGAFPMARRRELFEELQPLVCSFEEHPWNWAREHVPGLRGVREPLEPGQVFVVRAAAARARARGPLRPHGGLALPPPAAVRALAAGSRAGVVRLRPARAAGGPRCGADPGLVGGRAETATASALGEARGRGACGAGERLAGERGGEDDRGGGELDEEWDGAGTVHV